ncbi:MAG TPA: hypothetical protein VGF14_06265 [Alphaproteobacteria bacterium]
MKPWHILLKSALSTIIVPTLFICIYITSKVGYKIESFKDLTGTLEGYFFFLAIGLLLAALIAGSAILLFCPVYIYMSQTKQSMVRFIIFGISSLILMFFTASALFFITNEDAPIRYGNYIYIIPYPIFFGLATLYFERKTFPNIFLRNHSQK